MVENREEERERYKYREKDRKKGIIEWKKKERRKVRSKKEIKQKQG
jgi:hypothetical protein